jgi:starvation-inducible DNA-binding protein
MKTYATRIDLPAPARAEAIALLNQQLADTLDLFTQVKQAHWNVKGPYFIALHELFDKLAEQAEEYTDDLAERATTLGGVALGTARVAARSSRLPEIALEGLEGQAAVKALADRYAALAASTRAAIEAANRLGDADTADLFTEISRGLDKSLWFLEAHLQA